MTRGEHLAWCKDRALAYVERGDLVSAVASLISDLGKWEGGELYPSATLGTAAFMAAFEVRQGPAAVQRWIEGFN